MKNKIIKLSISLLICMGLTGLKAQQTIPSAGGNATGSGGTVSYSVGQLVYTTATGATGSVSHGVQQAYEISAVTAIEETKDITLQYMAYPNPVTNFLTLKIEGENMLQYSLSLFDIDGKLLENKKMEGNETTIDMGNLVPATYFLKVAVDNKEVKTFKIIKN